MVQMSPSDSGELSIHELARALGIDRKVVRRNIEAGMPRLLKAAEDWRKARIRPYRRSDSAKPKLVKMPPAESDEPEAVPRALGGGLKLLQADASDDLGAVVQWLRGLVKSYWAATQDAVQAGDTARADALCRQLQSLTRNLASTEKAWKQMEEKYGGLVSRGTMIRFWTLYKRSIDRCVCDLPESRQKAELINTLDHITMQFSADLRLREAIA